MAFFGLDIGSNTIKIVQLQKEQEKFRLIKAGSVKTPSPGLVSEAEKDLIAVAEAIKKLKKDTGIIPFEAVCSLPESDVFTRVIDFPVMSGEEIAQALPWELEEVVPISLSEAIYDWQIVRKNSSEIAVLVAVAPKRLVEKYLKVLKIAEIRPIFLETEALSLVRALRKLGPSKAKLILDFGARSTNLVVAKDEEIILTRSLSSAGKAITRSISLGLSLEEEVAEEYKKTYGLMEDQFGGKIQEAIKPILDLIMTEVRKSLEFVVEKKKEKVQMIVLSGGGANFPEFSGILAKEFGVEVQIADVFPWLVGEEKMMADFKKVSPGFTVAVGLAMKEI